MDEQVSSDAGEKLPTRFKISRWTWWVIAFPFVLAIVMIWGYLERFGSCISDTPVPNTSSEGLELSCLYSFGTDQWGQAGDFLGGILNPFIGLATVILLVNSIRQNHIALQQNQAALTQNEQALRDSKEELKISNAALHEQKDLMAAEYRERCFISLIVSLDFSLDRKVVSGPFPTTLASAVTVSLDKMTWDHVGQLEDNFLSPKLADFFQQQLQYMNGLSAIYRMETNRTGKDMLGLRLLSSTSIDCLFLFGLYMILSLKKEHSNYKESLRILDDNPSQFGNESNRITDSFLGNEKMRLDILVMLVDTILLSTQKGFGDRLNAEMQYYKRSR